MPNDINRFFFLLFLQIITRWQFPVCNADGHLMGTPRGSGRDWWKHFILMILKDASDGAEVGASCWATAVTAIRQVWPSLAKLAQSKLSRLCKTWKIASLVLQVLPRPIKTRWPKQDLRGIRLIKSWRDVFVYTRGLKIRQICFIETILVKFWFLILTGHLKCLWILFQLSLPVVGPRRGSNKQPISCPWHGCSMLMGLLIVPNQQWVGLCIAIVTYGIGTHGSSWLRLQPEQKVIFYEIHMP